MRDRSFLVGSVVVAASVALGIGIRVIIDRSEPTAARQAAANPTNPRHLMPPRANAAATPAVATREIVAEDVEDEAELEPDLPVESVPPDSANVPDSVLLHVLDAATKAELGDVSLLPIVEQRGWTVPHPGSIESRTAVVAHATSPVRLFSIVDGVELPTEDFWVGAPAHAWCVVKIRFWDADELTVELQPAARLIVDLGGSLARPRDEDEIPHLRLRRPPSPSSAPGEVIAEMPAQLGETRIEGLPAGDLVASVEIGWEFSSPLVVASVATTLVEQQTAHLALALSPIELPEAVPVAGTLYVPEGWAQRRLRLEIWPSNLRGAARTDRAAIALEEMEAIAGRPGWHRWNAGRLHPASYEFAVRTAGIVHEIKVAPPGDEALELVLPEPSTLIAHALDVESGEPLKLRDLEWSPDDDEGHRRPAIDFESDADGLRYEAVVPTGLGTVKTHAGEWILEPGSTRTAIHSGVQELTVRAHRACGLAIQFARDGNPTELPSDCWFSAALEAIGHDGVAKTKSHTTPGGITTLYATRAGRYRVTIPQTPGDEPIAPFEVDLPAATILTQVVELKRR